jgi:hypothetical protein
MLNLPIYKLIVIGVFSLYFHKNSCKVCHNHGTYLKGFFGGWGGGGEGGREGGNRIIHILKFCFVSYLLKSTKPESNPGEPL